jgi:chorismate dehydratase
MLHIGEINYLNCAPLFAALRSSFPDSGYHFTSGTPAELNEKLRAGKIDLSPSSSIEYARNSSAYLVLPDLSISSVGAVKSVMLFATVPIDELDGATIALSCESETSVALLRILLARRYSFSNRFVTSGGRSASLDNACAATLLIGDSALRQAADAGNFYMYDLGEIWYEFTGYPFVFALWLLRKAVQDDMPAAAMLVHARILAAKQQAMGSLAEIAGTLDNIDWTTREFIIDYWQSISYDLSPQHIAGLQLFYRYAVDEDLLVEAPSINFLGGH